MPIGLWLPLQLDSGPLLLLGPYGAKAREEKAQGSPWVYPGVPRAGRARPFGRQLCCLPRLLGFPGTVERPGTHCMSAATQ